MPETTSPQVELTCLKGLADHERIEGPFLNALAASDPEGAAVMLRLLLAHMASTSKLVMLAMVLDRVDAEERATASKAVGHDCLQRPAKS